MVENLSQEKLKNLLDEIVVDGSSIGVHEITKENPFKIYNKILEEGMYSRGGTNASQGITSTIWFCGRQNYDFDVKKLWDWYFQKTHEGEHCKIIIALPEIIEKSDGTKYYMGKYDNINTYLSNQYTQYKIIDKIPSEFIVGCILFDLHNDINIDTTRDNYRFVLNPNYIGLKNIESQKMYYDEYNAKFALTEERYLYFMDELSKMKTDDPFYIFFKDYIKKYEELNMSKKL